MMQGGEQVEGRLSSFMGLAFTSHNDDRLHPAGIDPDLMETVMVFPHNNEVRRLFVVGTKFETTQMS
jgi:hypothetical protein